MNNWLPLQKRKFSLLFGKQNITRSDEFTLLLHSSISGPNTWQEWSREGRRPYPMLPRVAPQTALALIANNVAEETAQENSKLPYPTETAEVVKEEQKQKEYQKSLEAVPEGSYVVTNDPVSVFLEFTYEFGLSVI